MSHDWHPAHTPPPTPLSALWSELSQPWGDVSADQADGFAPVNDTELPGPDLNDDRGYGFGV
jgi:hypothetical protein